MSHTVCHLCRHCRQRDAMRVALSRACAGGVDPGAWVSAAQIRRGDIGDQAPSNRDRLDAATDMFGSAGSFIEEMGPNAPDETLIAPVLTKLRQLGKIAVSLGQVMSSYARV